MRDCVKRIRFTVLAVLAAIVVQSYPLQHARAQESSVAQQKVRFADEIDAFLKTDSVNPPPKNAILFIGSSTFRLWTHVNEHMAPLPAFNRAFGGSRTHEVLYYMDKIVLPYDPRIIVYYCGSNDIAGGVNPEAVLRNFTAFCEKVKAKLPATKIFFVAIAKAPSRIAHWGAMDSANTMIGEYCRSTENLAFIELNPILFDAGGKPRLELYRDDKLHFKDHVYLELSAIIKPVLEKAWKTMR
jgi:hypothetical protein